MIWFEATAVCNEGRANPRQLYINENTLDSFKNTVRKIKATSKELHGFEPLIIVQLTHSGRYSKPNGTPEPIIAYRNELLEKAYSLYLLTVDKRYIKDDVIFNFIEKSLTVFIDNLDGTVFKEKTVFRKTKLTYLIYRQPITKKASMLQKPPTALHKCISPFYHMRTFSKSEATPMKRKFSSDAPRN